MSEEEDEQSTSGLSEIAGTRLLSACDYVQQDLIEGVRKVQAAAKCPICFQPTTILTAHGFSFKVICPNGHIIRVDEAWLMN